MVSKTQNNPELYKTLSPFFQTWPKKCMKCSCFGGSKGRLFSLQLFGNGCKYEQKCTGSLWSYLLLCKSKLCCCTEQKLCGRVCVCVCFYLRVRMNLWDLCCGCVRMKTSVHTLFESRIFTLQCRRDSHHCPVNGDAVCVWIRGLVSKLYACCWMRRCQNEPFLVNAVELIVWHSQWHVLLCLLLSATLCQHKAVLQGCVVASWLKPPSTLKIKGQSSVQNPEHLNLLILLLAASCPCTVS